MRAILLAIAAAAALAASPAAASSLQVPIDHSVRLAVAGSASAVVVGNPSIADVTVIDSHTLFVSGRGFGTTDVVVLDPLGRTLYSGEINVGGSAQGHVAVYRGAERSDLACSPGCQASVHEGKSDGGGGGSNGAAGAATSAATTAAGIGGAGAIAHAMSPS